MKRYFLILFLFFSAVLSAQTTKSAGFGLDPSDEEAVAQMKARMAKIRAHRPTLALVLSGGGAKGSAHVGVIRYLEEQKIPVDMICGTSMGGLVGGIAAMGYDSHYMDSLLRVQNWNVMLTDRIHPKYFPYARKMYRETYLLSVPFKYSRNDFEDRIDEQLRFFDHGAQMAIGENSLASSLPSGYAYGFNVNNLFSSISVGYEEDMSFADLPIPYFCVATDMVSLKAKYWAEGSVKTAMRSTMGIPILFKPVRHEGMILVDGGTRNNFPVDLAKAMGCDIIIGVDLSDLDPSYSQLNNIGDILMQFISMLGRTTFNRNKGETDVFIKPDLVGYNMLSFTPVAIDTMIHRGYVAAKAKASELAEVKALVGDAQTTYQAPKAIDINHTPVRAYVLEFRGVTAPESRMLHRKVRFKGGSYVDKARMDQIMSIVEATGCFSYVSYRILGEEEPYRIVVDCEKGPRHQFGAGVRFDTEEWASFIFNLGLNAHKLNGVKFDIDAKVGRSQTLAARAALDVSFLPTINVDAKVYNVSSSIYPYLTVTPSDCRWWGHRERAYISNLRWTSIDFALGAQYRYYRLAIKSEYGYEIGRQFPMLQQGGYMGFFGNGTLYTQDRSYYPSRGVKLTFGAEYDFAKTGVADFKPLPSAYLNFNSVLRLGRRLAIIPDIHARALYGGPDAPDALADGVDPAYSIAHCNYIGGVMSGRYIDHQMPFIGFGNVYKAGPYAAVANLSVRLRLGEKFFVSAIGGGFREAETPQDFISSFMPTKWGAGAELGYVTPIGPVKVLGTWCDRTHDFYQDAGFYVSLGFDF